MVNGEALADPLPYLSGRNRDGRNRRGAADKGRRGDGFAGPAKHHDLGHPGNGVRLPPSVQVAGRIGPEQDHPLLPWFALLQGAEGIDSVARSRPGKLDPLQDEVGLISNGQLYHAGPILGGGGVPLLERLRPCHQKSELRERELPEKGLSGAEMPVMNGVEAAAEQADHCIQRTACCVQRA